MSGPPSTTQGGVSPVLPTPAGGPGNIAAMPAAAPAPRGAATEGEIATVLAKLDALIGAISRESGFLEKVLS